jgi:hypothetical protein
VQEVSLVDVQVLAPGVEVTVNRVIVAPPFASGAVQDTTDCPFAFDVAETPVGASGTVDGTAAAEGTEATEVPLRFVAVTVKV